MKKWEYTFALIDPLDDPCIEINQLGAEGWEAFAYWPENKENHGGFYLRREVVRDLTHVKIRSANQPTP